MQALHQQAEPYRAALVLALEQLQRADAAHRLEEVALLARGVDDLLLGGVAQRPVPDPAAEALLNVIADAKTKVYGDADPSLTYQVSGLKNGDSAGSILTGGLNRAAGENVGVYGINQGILQRSNSLSSTSMKLRFEPLSGPNRCGEQPAGALHPPEENP